MTLASTARAAVPRFIAMLAIAAMLLGGGVRLAVQLDDRGRVAANLAEELGHIETAEQVLWQEFIQSGIDARFLAGAPEVQDFVQHGDVNAHERVVALFASFVRAAHHYGRIRLIGVDGHESIRVEYGQDGTSLVRELEDSSTDRSFDSALKLSSGELYASPFELDTQNGRVVFPYQPVVRFATPVFDAAGGRRGIIVLDHLGEALLEQFRAVKRLDHPQGFMLIDSRGYWLSGVSRDDEWGFQLPQRAERSFGHDFADAWGAVQSGHHGTLPHDGGFIAFDTFVPTEPDGDLTGSGIALRFAIADQWKIVSVISADEISAGGLYKEATTGLLAAVSATLVAAAWLIAYFSTSRRQARQALAENEARLREITETMGEGLLVTDAGGHIAFANAQAAKLSGYGPEELAGADLHELLHVHPDGSASPRSECRVLAGAAGGDTGSIDETFRRKDGGLLPVETRTGVIVRNAQTVGTISTFHDVTQLKALQYRLREQALHDPLTGLANRLSLKDALERELARARRQCSRIAFIIADIDLFKRVNDVHGHQVGDEVLRACARVLQDHTRASDICCRYGGEEFLLVLPGIDREGAHRRAESIRSAIAATIVETAKGPVRVTCSFGVAAFPENGESADSVIAAADAAMYLAKGAGRDRVMTAPTRAEVV